MRYTTIPQIKIIRGETPEEFERDFNEEMLRLAKSGEKFSVEYDLANLTAFIHYELDKAIAESVKDRYELGGCRHTCGDCSHLMKTNDRRLKRFACELDSDEWDWHRVDEPACEVFYRELDNERRERSGAKRKIYTFANGAERY